MADAVGINGLHSVAGHCCDLCGRPCDPATEDLNALDCTFPNCPSDAAVYHQDCLEKHLKSIRCEKNRKTGFKCPRGCGKGTRFPEPCPGKIDKSHPIHMRSDLNKKRKKAKQPDMPVVPATKPTAKAKSGCKKEEDTKSEKEKLPSEKEKLPSDRETSRLASKSSLGPLASSCSKSLVTGRNSTSKKDFHTIASSSIIRKETPFASASNSKFQQSTSVKEFKTLDEYEASKVAVNAEVSVPLQNAWSSRSLSVVLSASQSQALSATDCGSPVAAPAPVKRQQSEPKLPPPVQPDQKLQGIWAHRETANAIPISQPATSKPLGSQPSLFPPPPPPRQPAADPGAVPPKLQQDLATASCFEFEVKLTKAQRKNLKRAEKKAAARKAGEAQGYELSEAGETEDTSVASQGRQSVDFSESGFSMPCLEAVALRKVLRCVELLHQIGFPEDKCVRAVSQFGDQLEPAVTYLLRDSLQAGDDQPSLDLVAASTAVDVADEILRLQELQSWLGCAQQVIEQAVIDCYGDIEAAASILYERLDQTSQDSTTSWYSERLQGEAVAKYSSSLELQNGTGLLSKHHEPIGLSSFDSAITDCTKNTRTHQAMITAAEYMVSEGCNRVSRMGTQLLPEGYLAYSCITPEHVSWSGSTDSAFATLAADCDGPARLHSLERQTRPELLTDAPSFVTGGGGSLAVTEAAQCSQHLSQLAAAWEARPQQSGLSGFQIQHGLLNTRPQWLGGCDAADLPAQQDVPEAALLAAAAVASELDTTNVSSEDIELNALMATLMCK